MNFNINKEGRTYQYVNNVYNKNTKHHKKIIDITYIGIKSKVLGSCENISVNIKSINSEVVVELPIILTELILGIDLNSLLEMPYGTTKIIEINNKLKIIECLLMESTNVIFIKGSVIRKVKYNTYFPSNIVGNNGDVKYCILKVPFEASIGITFDRSEPAPVMKNTTSEFEYSSEANNLGGLYNKKGRETINHYNNIPFCKIKSSRIIENIENVKINEMFSTMRTLGTERKISIENKMYIEVKVEILQERDVVIRQKPKE